MDVKRYPCSIRSKLWSVGFGLTDIDEYEVDDHDRALWEGVDRGAYKNYPRSGSWSLETHGPRQRKDILNPRNLCSIEQMHAEMATDDFKKPRHQDRRRMIKWAKTLARELGTSEPPPLR